MPAVILVVVVLQLAQGIRRLGGQRRVVGNARIGDTSPVGTANHLEWPDQGVDEAGRLLTESSVREKRDSRAFEPKEVPESWEIGREHL